MPQVIQLVAKVIELVHSLARQRDLDEVINKSTFQWDICTSPYSGEALGNVQLIAAALFLFAQEPNRVKLVIYNDKV